MIYIPGYGLFPLRSFRPMNKVRFIGQAAPQFLGDVQIQDQVEQARTKLEALIGMRKNRDGGITSWPEWLVGVGITGVGPSREWNAISVMVLSDPEYDSVARSIPRLVDGIPVVVERSGKVVLLNKDMGANMRDVMKLNTDITSETLRSTFEKSIPAHGGTYVRNADASWDFVLDPATRVRLLLKGVNTPPSVSADKIVCWKTVPTHPLVGGFTHPVAGFHCRSAAIPVEWDVLLHGRPGLTYRGGYGNLLGDLEKGTPTQPIDKAQNLARQINAKIGVLKGKPEQWWIYTLPTVNEAGRPVVTIGVKGDYQPDAKELKALPWVAWRKHGVVIRMEFVPPKGSSVQATVAEIQPEAVPGMGSAPIDSVWPTSSPDYHEPTGPATGDDDPGMSGYGAYDSACPTCGQPAVGATKCIPGSYFCANGHNWTPPPAMGHTENCCAPGGRTRVGADGQPYYSCSHLELARLQKEQGMQGMGQSSHGFPLRWRDRKNYGTPTGCMISPSYYAEFQREAAQESGMGSAPVVSMPTGMLNWDRVSGYEGQPWVTKDWSHEGFMSDVGPSSGPAAPESKKASVAGLLGAVAGGAVAFMISSKFFAPQGRVSAETPVIAGATTAGAVSGLITAKAIAKWLES